MRLLVGLDVEGSQHLLNRRTCVICISLAAALFTVCIATGGCLKGFKRGPIPGVSETLLFRACSQGDLNRVKHLLDEGVNVNARQQDGETPLMFAAVEDKTDVVELLLDRGADIDAVSIENETALVRAVGMSRYETVALLLKRGANIEKSNPLMTAAGGGDVKMIGQLLDQEAKVNAADSEGYTALAAAVSRRVSHDVVRVLLKAGADVNIRNTRGQTPLMIAEQNDDKALVSLLTKSP